MITKEQFTVDDVDYAATLVGGMSIVGDLIKMAEKYGKRRSRSKRVAIAEHEEADVKRQNEQHTSSREAALIALIKQQAAMLQKMEALL